MRGSEIGVRTGRFFDGASAVENSDAGAIQSGSGLGEVPFKNAVILTPAGNLGNGEKSLVTVHFESGFLAELYRWLVVWLSRPSSRRE